MRTPEQLIQAALADAEYTNVRERPEHDVGPFSVFQVNLNTPRYRGLQPQWFFAVLRATDSPGTYESVHSNARALIAKAAAGQLLPLVFLSDNPSAPRLADMCKFERRDVFGIDPPDLPSARQASNPLRAPFIMAVRAKYSSTELSTRLFQPYSPMQPVDGWRFFGRRRELDEIVNSTGNFFIVGSRMTGKTSLLREASRLLQEEQGAQVHFVPLQQVAGTHVIADEILKTVAERERVAAVRRQKLLDEKLLDSVLKRLSRSTVPVVLILDELGNALGKSAQRATDWRVIGLLREYSQSGRMRVLMSGFQEIFVKQSDFEGPFINFTRIIRLSGFSNPEIDELLVEPLQFWGKIPARSQLREIATTRVGRNPLLLQYFGKALFDKIARRPITSDVDVTNAASHLLDSEGIEIFRDAVDQLFMRSGSASDRYLFLKRCHEADLAGENLVDAEIDDSWTRNTLHTLGYPSNYDRRRVILEALELKGLTTSIGSNASRQRIAAPIIYWYLKHSEKNVAELISVLGEDAASEWREFDAGNVGGGVA